MHLSTQVVNNSDMLKDRIIQIISVFKIWIFQQKPHRTHGLELLENPTIKRKAKTNKAGSVFLEKIVFAFFHQGAHYTHALKVVICGKNKKS